MGLKQIVMLQIIKKIFGTKAERDIRAIRPYLNQISREFETLSSLSHDELRASTLRLRFFIKENLKPISEEIESINAKITADSGDLKSVYKYQNDLENLTKEYDTKLEQVLLEILPQSFAIVKETCRRFATHSSVVVTATDFDRQVASEKDYVTVTNDEAEWQNSWDAHGSRIVWDMVPYDVQLLGGITLHQGKIAEMATGEGKTLSSIMPIFLNALAGKGVHVVTVNDYLSQRDSAWMAPIFEFHGLSVDCIDRHDPQSEARRRAYRADVVYGTNNEFGFDYLRDNMASSIDEVVQGKLHYAIVDEVDSVLIDDARTPLIISGPVQNGNEHEYAELKPTIQEVFDRQKAVVTQFFQEAKTKIAAGNVDEGGLALFRVYRGLPKYKPLIKFLSEKGIKQILYKTENYYLQENSKLMPEADEPLFFTIEEKNNSVEFTDKGLQHISAYNGDHNFFIIPDIGSEIATIDQDAALHESEKAEKKDSALKDFSRKSQRIHVIKQLLKAYTLFEDNVDYIVKNGKVKIVDEQTGRVLSGRRYSDGLHQALEAKENVEIQKSSQTYATITLQNYFRMYHKLAGMTGTAITEAGEFWEIYKLDVIEIPTNKPTKRDDKDDMVYKTMREKFNAVIEEINALTTANRPVLVGTTSVEISELISRMLSLRKIKHQVLNAKHHDLEAEIVSHAGKEATVTIATNMAGRGTDIKLSPEAKLAGGLAIIGTERHESRRVDRQLRGRSGRQGDVGSSQFFLSLEDPLMRLFGSERLIGIMDKLGLEEGEVIQHPMITRSIEKAQQKVEHGNFATRKRLLEYDNVMNSQRSILYKKRNYMMNDQYVEIEVRSIIYDTVAAIVESYSVDNNVDALNAEIKRIFGVENTEAIQESNNSKYLTQLTGRLYIVANEAYEAKKSSFAKELEPFVANLNSASADTDDAPVVLFRSPSAAIMVQMQVGGSIQGAVESAILNFEKRAILSCIDNGWREHLREMDELKQAVQNAVYERQDPLLIYKMEAYNLFKQFIHKLNKAILETLFSAKIFFREKRNAGDEMALLNRGVESASDYETMKNKLRELLVHMQNQATGSDNPEMDNVALAAHSEARGPKINRNDRITVRYADGNTKENVKYKTVEDDIKNGKCVIIDQE